MISKIGNNVAFSARVGSKEINEPLDLTKLQRGATSASSPVATSSMAARNIYYDDEPQKSNTGWYALGAAAVVGGTVLAGRQKWIGKVSEGLQKHYETADKWVVDGTKKLWNKITGKAEEAAKDVEKKSKSKGKVKASEEVEEVKEKSKPKAKAKPSQAPAAKGAKKKEVGKGKPKGKPSFSGNNSEPPTVKTPPSSLVTIPPPSSSSHPAHDTIPVPPLPPESSVPPPPSRPTLLSPRFPSEAPRTIPAPRPPFRGPEGNILRDMLTSSRIPRPRK